MDVGKARWPQVDEVFFLDRISLTSQGVEGSLHIDRVPDDDSIGQEIQTSRLIGLAFFILLTHYPFAGKEEKLPQIMELLPFVELGMDALVAPHLTVVWFACNENGGPGILLLVRSPTLLGGRG